MFNIYCLPLQQSAEEKQLIDLVHRASQSNHERHLVSKANELRQVGHAFYGSNYLEAQADTF